MVSRLTGLIHGHLSYLREMPVSPYPTDRKEKEKGAVYLRDLSHKVTLIENLVYFVAAELEFK